MPKIQVLIADAHILTRKGLVSVLQQQKDFDIAGEALDSAGMKEILGRTSPDIVMIDFSVPGHFSLQDVAWLRDNHPDKGVLVITAALSKENVLRVLDFGISGYLLKECDENEVISAIYAIAQKEKYFCGKVMDSIWEKATHKCPPGEVCDHCQPVSLSAREVEIIRMIAEGNTTKEIAEKLFLSFHTVSTHRKNIFRKIQIRNSSELILYAMKKGIIATPEQNPQ